MPPQSFANRRDVVRPAVAPPAPIAAPVPFWDAVGAGFSDAVRNSATSGDEAAWQGYLRDRHARIEALTGQRFEPSRDMGVSAFGRDSPLDSDPYSADAGVRRQRGYMPTGEEYEARLDALRQADPRLAEVPTLEGLRRKVAEDALAARAAASQATDSGWTGAVGAFAGGMAGGFVDPVNIVATVTTGGVGVGRPLLQRMGMQALANTSAEVLATPVRAINAEARGGPEYTGGQAAMDIVGAGVLGALFEPAGDLLGLGFREAGRRFARSGDPGERGLAVEIDRLLDDEAALADAPDFDAARQALARGEPRPVVEPDRGLDELFAEAPPARVTGSDRQTQPGIAPPSGAALTSAEYRGRQIWSGRFDPLTLETDAARFQYKADGDAQGVTGRLRGVERWDATASGKAILFEENGRVFVADGHQRRGLATRLAEQGWEDAQLDAYLFRASDGWTAREVRVVSALKNIREGSGAVLDAAKLFREAPGALADRSLPVTGEFIHAARQLASLNDDAFRAVINGVIPERYGAVLGELAATRPELQGDLVALLKKADPGSADGARALIHEAMLDDFIATEGVQIDLFGGLPREATVIARGKIREAVMAGLRKDQRLFAQLVRNADAIESGGNTLATSENAARAAIDRAAAELVSRLSLRTGDMGEAFQEAARAVTVREATAAGAAKGLIARIRAAVKSGEAMDELRAEALTPSPPSEAARTAAKAFDQPGGAGQKAQIEPKPEDEWIEGPAPRAEAASDGPSAQRIVTRETLWERPAAELQELLEEAQASDQQKLVMALGEDGAKEFKRLDRKQNNSYDGARADEGAREFEALFGDDKLTDQQKRLIYGIGEVDASADDIRLVLDAHGDVLPDDPADWAAYMGAVGVRGATVDELMAVPRGEGSAAAQAAFVRLQAVSDYFSAQGVDANDLPRLMASALVRQGGWKPDQAAEIIGGFVDAMTTGRAAVAPAALRLEGEVLPPLEPGEDGPAGLFDDLPEDDGLDRAVQHLTACAPGRA